MNEAANRRRGRPRKTAAQRKDVDLRIPVTPEQKEIVNAAAQMAGEDMAAWARPILVQAATEFLSRTQNK